MSEIYNALTVAQDHTLRRLVDRERPEEAPPIEIPQRTDPSHGQIRRWLIVAFLTVAIVLVITSYAFYPNGMFAKTKPVFGVTFEGTVHPASEVHITADGGGTISKIAVKVGDTVQEGQEILRMDNRAADLGLKQARADLEAAQANLDQFRAQLAEANARVAVSIREEQQIPSRQFRDSPERAQAAYEQALVNYNRARSLHDAGVSAQQDLDEKATELAIAKDDLENAKRLAGASQKVSRDQQDQAAIQAKVMHEDLEEQLRQAQLKYERAKSQSDETTVRATQAGVIAEIPVHLGDHVSSGTTLARMAELDRMVADVPVTARMISELKVGQSAEIRLPSNPPVQVSGKIRVINPLPSPNMTHTVEVEFENPTLMLLASQRAEVQFSRQ